MLKNISFYLLHCNYHVLIYNLGVLNTSNSSCSNGYNRQFLAAKLRTIYAMFYALTVPNFKEWKYFKMKTIV